MKNFVFLRVTVHFHFAEYGSSVRYQSDNHVCQEIFLCERVHGSDGGVW